MKNYVVCTNSSECVLQIDKYNLQYTDTFECVVSNIYGEDKKTIVLQTHLKTTDEPESSDSIRLYIIIGVVATVFLAVNIVGCKAIYKRFGERNSHAIIPSEHITMQTILEPERTAEALSPGEDNYDEVEETLISSANNSSSNDIGNGLGQSRRQYEVLIRSGANSESPYSGLQ
ncbi:hypothetical protein DPMN_094580 [Dreissena polymorpha]|uniref:Uncharacterized protein n=1 Tax=Dreissena polymorpha TaxID=45954 RepID=A0A9D4L5B7_DREPO|nr:hypothetical protein DPMN_094580 [Dreissena polymorpha]